MGSYVKTPSKLAAKKAILNVIAYDSKCFIWCILAHLFPVTSNKERVSNYSYRECAINSTGLSFPITINQLDNFEKRNESISVNVFGWSEEEGLFPLRVTEFRGRTHHVNLLLLEDKHFCLITDLGKLCFTQTKHESKKFICNYCLQHQNSEEKHLEHVLDCMQHKIQRVSFSNKDVLKFESHGKQMDMPVIVYADFESMITNGKHR